MANRSRAVIEIGSNSLKLHSLNPFCDRVEVTQLLKAVVDGEVRYDSPYWKKTYSVLGDFKKFLTENLVKDIYCLGTEVLRKIKNIEGFKRKLGALNLYCCCLSSQEEALLGYEVIRGLYGDGVITIDIGGGSSEISFRDGEKFLARSFPLGAVTLTEKYKLSESFSLDTKKVVIDYINEVLTKSAFSLFCKEFLWVGIGGAVTVLVSLLKDSHYNFSPASYEGKVITLEELDFWIDKLRSCNTYQRFQQWGIPLERAEILPAGGLILFSMLKYYGVKEIQVSFKGIRHFIYFEDLCNQFLKWCGKK